MDFAALIDVFLHVDKHLGTIIETYHGWTYLILFLVVFCETGLVVTPFLPGDSLLFATGAFAARGSLELHSIAGLLFVAAVLGDAVNYAIGHYFGPKLLERPNSKIFRKEYLDRTHRFYEKYGGKTIIFARFVPIVRTFAPFLAGVGAMTYTKFALYNVTGAALWILLFVYGGYMFGDLPFVRKNFSLVILAIIILSVLPAVIEVWKAKRESRQAPSAAN
ncbi:MAG: DedA family protein [Deltaproteobacteria bacterium]|nr:DedA family protein [Deltaproteobacteria bacterium]